MHGLTQKYVRRTCICQTIKITMGYKGTYFMRKWHDCKRHAAENVVATDIEVSIFSENSSYVDSTGMRRQLAHVLATGYFAVPSWMSAAWPKVTDGSGMKPSGGTVSLPVTKMSSRCSLPISDKICRYCNRSAKCH
jgi:hypothetical protein